MTSLCASARLLQGSELQQRHTPPLLSRRALLAGVSRKPLSSLGPPSAGRLSVQLFKRGSPGASPSVLSSIPLILENHGADRGPRRGRLSAVRQENPTPRAAVAV
ncbi:hypothetical protein EYF80_005401 [Liparis tanakae]|uniref:Uncharacterized protein n=1 Tax=Liparis tanakae TaxID=230148 RepID=A0A4Z2J3Z3_9TELE|nr:hypothetical protein EYF80_005401 [Liparis tanakae]